MDPFGGYASDKLIDEIYPLVWQATERLKEARLLRKHIDAVAAQAPWLTKRYLEDMSNCLERYGVAMLITATLKLNKHYRIEPKAIEVKVERNILALFFGEEAGRHIRHLVYAFDDQDGLPSVRSILRHVMDSTPQADMPWWAS